MNFIDKQRVKEISQGVSESIYNFTEYSLDGTINSSYELYEEDGIFHIRVNVDIPVMELVMHS